MLGCYPYIELNPVRANRAEHPAVYRCSSYRAYAQGETIGLLTPHLLYKGLGNEKLARQAAYRELFRYELDTGLIDEIRSATNKNDALGSPQIEATLGRRVTPRKSGWPRENAERASKGFSHGC